MDGKGWHPDRWKFSVEEKSPSVWVATAEDQQGEVLRRTRFDAHEALRLVKQDAAEVTRRRLEAADRD